MRKKLVFALILILLLVPTGLVQAKKPAPALRGTTEYTFVGHLEIECEGGGLLVWQGTISGDIEGEIRWCMEPMEVTGQASHFVDRVEIWDGDTLLLAGDEAGTTTVRHGKNSVWRANGIVTYASEGFEDWIGRHIHEGGKFE